MKRRVSVGDNRSRRVWCTHYSVNRSCLLAVPTLPPLVVQLVTTGGLSGSNVTRGDKQERVKNRSREE